VNILKRKARTVAFLAGEQSALCGPVQGIIATHAHVSRIFTVKGSGILCSADSVAEREGFGPTVHIDNT
jgi:hypothetical protein